MDIKTDPQLETHPYNSCPIPPDTKILIVGTAPPPRFSLPRPPHHGPEKGWDADFFYGSGSNYLWVYLENAAGEPIFAEPGTLEAAVEDTETLMRDFLRRHRIWMRDVLQTYRRKRGYESSSKDRHIDLESSDTTYADFSAVVKPGRNIKKVVFTSGDAAEWFFKKALAIDCASDIAEKYCQIYVAAERARKERVEVGQYTREFCKVEFDGNTIKFHVAPSPSGSAWGPDKKTCTEIYRTILFAED